MKLTSVSSFFAARFVAQRVAKESLYSSPLQIEELKMETPLHIDFQGMESPAALRTAIARHVEELEKRFGRITACRVMLKDPGRHHRTGGLFEVHIRLTLPGEKEVNIGHKPDADGRHADVNFAINDAFKRARRVLQDQVRRMQGHVKTHVRPT